MLRIRLLKDFYSPLSRGFHKKGEELRVEANNEGTPTHPFWQDIVKFNDISPTIEIVKDAVEVKKINPVAEVAKDKVASTKERSHRMEFPIGEVKETIKIKNK